MAKPCLTGILSLAALSAFWPQAHAQIGNTDGAITEAPVTQETGSQISESDPRDVKIRLGADLAEDEATLRAALDRHGVWEIVEDEDAADYELIRDPEFFDDFMLLEIKRDGSMDAEQVVDFYTDEYVRRNAWAFNVPQPYYLGGIEDQGFFDRLAGFADSIARAHGLLALKTNKSSSGSAKVCVSEAVPPPGYCPIRAADGLMKVPAGAVSVATVEVGTYERDTYINALAIGPDNTVSLLMSRKIPGYPIYDQASPPAYYYLQNDTYSGYFEEPGLYRVVTIVDFEPIDPEIFSIRNSAQIRPDQCQTNLERLFCDIMAGTRTREYYSEGHPYEVAVTEFYAVKPLNSRQYAVNGRFALPTESLWQVQLFKKRDGPPLGTSGDQGRTAWRQNFEKAHQCGGSYIGDGYVLTAAHCVPRDSPKLYLRMGTRDIAGGGRSFSIASTVVHSSYAKGNDYDDIAVLRIDSRQISAAEKLVAQGRLASVQLETSSFAGTTNLLVTGWGFLGRTKEKSLTDINGLTQRNPRYLQAIDLKPTPNSRCGKVPGFETYNMDKVVCAAGTGFKDACFGDSGGPMTRKSGAGRVLVGIVSGGEGCAATENAPGLYTRVSSYSGWIKRAKAKAQTPGWHKLGD